jgi:hypothetical protein
MSLYMHLLLSFCTPSPGRRDRCRRDPVGASVLRVPGVPGVPGVPAGDGRTVHEGELVVRVAEKSKKKNFLRNTQKCVDKCF